MAKVKLRPPTLDELRDEFGALESEANRACTCDGGNTPCRACVAEKHLREYKTNKRAFMVPVFQRPNLKAKHEFYVDCSPNGVRYFINGTLVSHEAYEREYEKDYPKRKDVSEKPLTALTKKQLRERIEKLCPLPRRTTTRMKPKAKRERWVNLFLVNRGYATGGYIAPEPMMIELSHMAHEKMTRLHRKCANEEQMIETINQFDVFQDVADFNDYFIRAYQIMEKWKVLLDIPSAA